MLRFGFKKGLSFLDQTHRWSLQRRLATGVFQFEDELGEIRNLRPDEVLDLWLKRTWILDESSLGTMSDAFQLVTARDLGSFPDQLQKVARRRLQYLEAVDAEHQAYDALQWQPLIAQLACKIQDPQPPCPSTVHSWWRRYRQTKNILALIPRSNRRTRRKLSPVQALFEEVVSMLYLTSQQKPKQEVVNQLQAQVRSLNQQRSPSDQLKVPSRSTIYRWFDSLHQDLVDASRLGAVAARMKYRTAMGKLKVDGILERVEIDHTPLDILVIDGESGLPLGRPWLTLAIDKASRMILGFYISFDTPSAHAVLQCLKMAILPKTAWLERFPDVKGAWPACGLPDLIAVDNGMDLHADAVRDACQELGIQILFCPARDPYTKGSVERCFRTINQDLMHQLPGTVFSNVLQRGDYPSETAAALDLETLMRIFVMWVVDVYHHTHHRGIGTTPYLKWMQQFEDRVFHWPANPESLDVITGIPAERTLFHYGIELEGLHYNSLELQQLRRISGDNLRVSLKFYEATVDYIHVFDPFSKQYLRVEVVDSTYAQSLSRHTHRLIREHARAQHGEKGSRQQLLETKTAIQEIIQQSLKHKKMASRKQSAKAVLHDSEAMLQGRAPLAQARKPIRQAPLQAPPPLPDGLHDTLPDIASMGLPSLDLDDDDAPDGGPKP